MGRSHLEKWASSLSWGFVRSSFGSRLILVILGLIVLLVIANSAYAQDPTRAVTDDEVNAIAKELYCPVCESTPLDVCATQACADWREVIRTKLAEGQTEEEIKAYFELQYGPRALAEPPRQGFTLGVWILPIVAVVIGGLIFLRYVRGLRTTPVQAEDQAIKADAGESEADPDDYRARIERELREM